MEEEIILGDKKIKCLWQVGAKTRNLRLAVHPDGFLSVSLPSRLSRAAARDFILEKSAWILTKISYFNRNRPDNKVSDGYNDFLRRKRDTYGLVSESLERINTFYNFKYGKVSIRNQKSRWGSCSAAGDLNFNYRLCYLPAALLYYVVAHELCHLKEMNHSRSFWRLVSVAVPDYRRRRSELKKESLRFW